MVFNTTVVLYTGRLTYSSRRRRTGWWCHAGSEVRIRAVKRPRCASAADTLDPIELGLLLIGPAVSLEITELHMGSLAYKL